MKTVWVTGAKGFIGSYLSQSLSARGLRVFGIGHGKLSEVELEASPFNAWVGGDISAFNLRSLADLSGLPTIIYHLAGGSSVGFSLEYPAEDYRRTVGSTEALLSWIHQNSPQTSLVLTSSAAVYGGGHQSPIKEESICSPYSPYGFHKRSAELLCESYARHFNLKIAIVRFFSIYGPGLKKQFLWDFCNRINSDSKNVFAYGTGEEFRDWLYILDAVRLLEILGDRHSDDFLLLNGGTGHGTKIYDIATQICSVWGCDSVPQFIGQSRPGDPHYLVADTRRLETLNFFPNHSLSSGLAQYVDWFKHQSADESA